MKGIYSIIVVRNNYMVLERYFREGHRLKPHNLKSATKSVLSALTGIAIDKGYLHLDQPISDFLPQIKSLDDPRKADITVQHLLAMTSGLEPTSYQAYNSLIMNGTDWVQTILNLPLVADPGTKHQYSTGDTHLLSAVLTGATRMSTREFAEKNLFDPLGISVKGWEIDPQGINQGGNNLSLIPLDMVLFGQLYLNDGLYRDKQIIPKWWVDSSTRPNYLDEHEVYGYYGYLWYSRPRGNDAYVAVGYGGQYIYVSPEYNTVIVITSTLESKGKEWERELFDNIQYGILGSIKPEQQQLQKAEFISATSPEDDQSKTTGSQDASGEKRIGLAIANLNLRKGPNRSSSIITLLNAGTVLEIEEQKNSWLKVKAKKLNGWVSSKYVRFINPDRIKFAKQVPDTDSQVGQKAAQQTLEPLATARRSPEKDEALRTSQELVRQLQKRLETTEKTKQQLESDLAGAREKLAAEQRTADRLETDHKALEKELTELKVQIETQSASLRTAVANRDTLQAELATLQKELAELQAVNSQSAVTKTKLEKKLAATLNQIEELKEAQGRVTQQEAETLEKLEQAVAAERAQLETVKQELLETRAGSKDIKAKLAEANKELENQRQAVAKSETAHKTVEMELAGMQDQLDTQTRTLTTVQAKRDTLQEELDALRQEVSSRQEKISRSELQQSSLEAELATAREQLKKLQAAQSAALDRTEDIRQKLEQDLATEQAQVVTLKKQLQELQDKEETTAAKISQASE
ncbi:MAG: serine hydrolase, partial [Deltaproteobacteria bacterium]